LIGWAVSGGITVNTPTPFFFFHRLTGRRSSATIFALLFSFGLALTGVYIVGQTRISNCDVLFP
jgi:hypothetical protein